MDKLDKLYELYKSKGIITDATPIEKFRAASEEQREKLYNIGKSKNLFKTTDLNTFNSAWEEGVTSKKKEESVSPSVQEDTSSATQGMASPEPLVYFQDLLMRGNKAIDQGKSSEYKKIKEEIEVLAQSNPESLGTEEAKAEYKKLNDRYSNIFKVEEPLRLESFVPNAAEISKKAGSDVNYTPEELKAKNFVNLVRLGTVGDLNERLQKDEERIEEEFAEEDLGSKALKLYDKFVTSPMFRQYSRTRTVTEDIGTKKEKYLEKAAQQIATQWNKPTPPTEEDILNLAKEIRRKELNKYSEEKAIEEVVANSDDENYFEKLYNNYKSISDPASAVISEMESTNEKTVIKNALQSAELKRKEHIEDFSTKQELVERALNEFNSLREEYGEDITKYTKEQLISLEAAQSKAKDLYDDLEQNYSKIENDASSIGSAEEELDLFKRNYGALSKFMGEFSAGATDLAAGFAGIGEMAFDLAQVSDTESNTIIGRAANFLSETSEGIRGSVSRPKELDKINSVGEFMEFAGSLFASQAPQLLMNASTGGAGLYLMASSSAGNKYMTTFKDEKEYEDWQRYVSALGVGLAEFGSEYLTGRVLQRAFPSVRLARAAEKGASKAELELLKSQFASGLQKGIKATSRFAKNTVQNFNEEGLSEVVAQMGGNFVDRQVLGKKNVGILDGVSDAYLTGGILGSGLSAAPALFSGVVAAFTKDPNKIIAKNLKKIDKLISAHANASSNAVKRSINQEIGQLKEENNAIIVGGLERLNKMSPKEIRRAVEIHEAIGNIREEFSNVDKDKSLSKEEKDEVKSFLAQRYNQLVTEKTQLIEKADAVQEQTTSEVPVQPEARVGEEVAQGTPQAESEVITEEGRKEEDLTFEEATDEDISSEEAKTLFDKAKQKGAKQLVEVARDDSGKIIAAKFEYQDEAGNTLSETVMSEMAPKKEASPIQEGKQKFAEQSSKAIKAVKSIFKDLDFVHFENADQAEAWIRKNYGDKFADSYYVWSCMWD